MAGSFPVHCRASVRLFHPPPDLPTTTQVAAALQQSGRSICKLRLSAGFEASSAPARVSDLSSTGTCSWGGNYTYLQRDSTLPGTSYTQNVLVLRLGTQFRLTIR
jgi:hypothetical protein